MSIEFISGEPPALTSRFHVDWEPIAAKLEANTGQWAIVDVNREGTRLRTLAYNIRNHRKAAATRVREGFDAVARNEKLYMRHIGP